MFCNSCPNITLLIENIASQFSGALSYMDTLQVQIADSLKNNDADLKLMKETFDQNMDFLKKTLESYDKRMNALK